MSPLFRVKKQTEPEHCPDTFSANWFLLNPDTPITLCQINSLPESARRRIYHLLLPPDLLVRFNINPLTWRGPDGGHRVFLKAEPETPVVSLSVRATPEPEDEFAYLELSDNNLNGVHLDFILLGDPKGPRYNIDRTVDGNSTWLGSAGRNLPAEEEAMRAGLAPAQVRQSLGASRAFLQQIEIFLSACGHVAYYLEPLTYVSAWVFERYGFAYTRGHKLMDDIHREFQPGGCLHSALDGSTPFRQLEQSRTVRGRGWAIHDGVLAVMDANWDGIRMVKQLGRYAGVETFPGAVY
jgi:hypothetical protein